MDEKMKERGCAVRVTLYAVAALATCLSASSCYKGEVAPAAPGAVSGGGVAPGQEPHLNAAPVLIDVRTSLEYSAGHLDGARLMPYDAIGSLIEAQVPDKRTRILLYCRSGGRSEMARETLVGLGYANVENLGGLQAAAGKLQKKVVK